MVCACVLDIIGFDLSFVRVHSYHQVVYRFRQFKLVHFTKRIHTVMWCKLSTSSSSGTSRVIDQRVCTDDLRCLHRRSDLCALDLRYYLGRLFFDVLDV